MADQKEALPRFSLPGIAAEPQGGWGPSGKAEQFAETGIPFTPFNKGDRLGKVSDWGNTWGRRDDSSRAFGGNSAAFTYKVEEDETSFSLVDNKVKNKPKWQKRWRGGGLGRGRWQPRGGHGGRGGRGGRGGSSNNNNSNNNNRRPWSKPWTPQEPKSASVEVSSSWKEVAPVEFAELNKARAAVEGVEDLTTAGTIYPYRRDFDTILPTNAQTLIRYDRQIYTTTTSADPVLQQLEEKKAGNVYATDTILSVLMAATRSVESWDLIFTKKDGVIHIDKRDGSRLDFLTVNENWNEVQKGADVDPVNDPDVLVEEATAVNHNFCQQALSKKDPLKLEQPNPYLDDAEAQGLKIADVGYRYRKFDLGDDTQLVVRCEVNAYTKSKKDGSTQYVCLRALNEFDPKLSGNVVYRQLLASQTSAVVATEMKNNANKIARWTAQSIVAGAAVLRFGFVTRVHTKDNSKHLILKTQKYKPKIFITQLKMTERNMWGVLKHLIDLVRAQEDGKYLLLKVPDKEKLQLFAVPDNFEQELAQE